MATDYEYFGPPDAPDDQDNSQFIAPDLQGDPFKPTGGGDSLSAWVWGTSQEWNQLFSNLWNVGVWIQVIVEWFQSFIGWLKGQFEGVPQSAKTLGTGAQLAHCKDPIAQFIGAQLIAGAEQGRVLSESNWPRNFGGRVLAHGGALIEFVNLEPPCAYWKVRDTPVRSISLFNDPPRQFRIGPVPPPANAPYSQPVVVGGFFSARVRSAADYKAQFGFDIPSPEQLKRFLMSQNSLRWDDARVIDARLADMRSMFLNLWQQQWQQWLLTNSYPPPGPMPDPCGLPEDPPCPPPTTNQGDQLTDQIGADSMYLYYIARGLQRIAAVAQQPPDETCCNQIVLRLAQLGQALSVIGGAVNNIQPATVDLSGVVAALGQLATAMASWPALWQAVADLLGGKLDNIANSVNAVASSADPSGIVQELKKSNELADVPADVLSQMIDDKIIPAQYAQFLQGSAWSTVLSVLRAAAGFSNRTAMAKLFGGDDSELSAGTKKAYDDIRRTAPALFNTTKDLLAGDTNLFSEELRKGFSKFLSAEDKVFEPIVKPLVDAIAAQLKPAAGAKMHIGNVSVDPDAPVSSATGVALTAALMAWAMSFAGIDEGESLKKIVELIAAAIGFEELRDVAIGPLIRHGIAAVADMKARATFRQHLPGAGEVASWQARGLMTPAGADYLLNLNGVADELKPQTLAAGTHGMQARQLIRLIETGLFTNDDLTNELIFSGMRAESQYRTLLAAPYLATQTQRAALRSAIEASYEAGLLTDGDLTSFMDSAEHNTDRNALILAAMQGKKHLALAKELEASYTALHEGGISDQPTYRAQLEGLGFQPDKVNALIAVAEAKLTVTAKRQADAAQRVLVRETAAAERKAAIENFKRGTIDTAALAAALIATGLTAVQAAAWTDLAVLQKAGAQRWIYGLMKTPAEATLLAQRVSALLDQRRRELIVGSQLVKALQDLGIPSNYQNALLARANATITPKKDAFVTAVGTGA